MNIMPPVLVLITSNVLRSPFGTSTLKGAVSPCFPAFLSLRSSATT